MEKALRLSGGTHTLQDVAEAIREGHMQCFWNETAVIVTEVAYTPRRKFVSIFLSAGDLDGVMGLHDKVADWAIENGYDFARIMVRPGFVRLLERKGWKKRQIMMELDLNGWWWTKYRNEQDRASSVA
jgi:hypothetical protein